MHDRFFSMSKHTSAILCLTTAGMLSGCVSSGHRRPSPPRPSAAVMRYHAATKQILTAKSTTTLQAATLQAKCVSTKSACTSEADSVSGSAALQAAATFQRVVWHLQSLGYLPITHAFIHGDSSTKIRHDAFLWPVPAALQKAADQYAWNAQNPFIRGAVIQFERENGILWAKGVSEGRLHKNVVRAILADSAKPNPYPWEWVYVTKASGTQQPERLHVWEHGQSWIWHTKINTGVLGST
ncbi:MAG: hypothetical protein ACYCRF_13140, partial [Acidithiobacillus sp.]